MKRILHLLFVCLLLSGCSSQVTTTDPPVDAPEDLPISEPVNVPVDVPVEDVTEYTEQSELINYLLMLPDDMVLEAQDQEIIDSIDVLDEANYYLHLSPLWLDGDASFTVFIAPDGSDLLAYEVKGCGPLCEQNVYFYKMGDDGLNDVTDIYMPELDFTSMADDFDSFNPIFILPQYSTTIEVIDQFSREVLYELHWKDGQFELEAV